MPTLLFIIRSLDDYTLIVGVKAPKFEPVKLGRLFLPYLTRNGPGEGGAHLSIGEQIADPDRVFDEFVKDLKRRGDVQNVLTALYAAATRLL
jgi:hypothetical protein